MRGGEKQQRDDKILRRLRLLAAEDEKREAGRRIRKDHDLDIRAIFQIAQQFVAGPAAPRFARGEPAFDEPAAFKKIEHVVILLAR